jgi:hypothetical protein
MGGFERSKAACARNRSPNIIAYAAIQRATRGGHHTETAVSLADQVAGLFLKTCFKLRLEDSRIYASTYSEILERDKLPVVSRCFWFSINLHCAAGRLQGWA